MDDELLHEWVALEDAARRWFLLPGAGSGEPALCAARFPSFEPAMSWTAVLRSPEAQSVAIECRWDVETDHAKFASVAERRRHGPRLDPTMLYRKAPIDAASVEALRRASAIVVPASPTPGASGLDGTRWILQCGAGGAMSRHQWWETPPPEWAALAALHREIERVVRASVAHLP